MSDPMEMPLTSITRIMKATLPSNIQMGKDVRSALARATGLFVLYLTNSANDFCRSSGRTTISSDDIVAATEELEFTEFCPALVNYARTIRRDLAIKRKIHKAGLRLTDDGDDDQRKKPGPKKGTTKRKLDVTTSEGQEQVQAQPQEGDVEEADVEADDGDDGDDNMDRDGEDAAELMENGLQQPNKRPRVDEPTTESTSEHATSEPTSTAPAPPAE